MRDALLRAAEARAGQYRALGDRPQKRRAGEHGAPAVAVIRSRPMIRDSSSTSGGIEFSGYASVTDTGYEMWDMWGPYTEVVNSGAFADSLAREDLDVPLVLQHVDIRRLARTTITDGLGSLSLAEDDTGLRADATLDPADPDVAYIVPKMRSGLVDEMSFKFSITRGQWSSDWTEFHIDGADIHRGDVAICGYGANPATAAAVRTPNDLAAMLASVSDDEARAHLEALQARFTPKTPASSRLSAALDRSYRSAL